MLDNKEIFKEAQKMQDKMQGIQAEIDKLKITGKSGNGLVEIVINGACNCIEVKIDSSLLVKETDKKVVEELVAAAFNHGVKQLSEQKTKKIQLLSKNISLTSDLKLPF